MKKPLKDDYNKNGQVPDTILKYGYDLLKKGKVKRITKDARGSEVKLSISGEEIRELLKLTAYKQRARQ